MVLFRSLRLFVAARGRRALCDVRLSKRMAELGLCSRREADALIAAGDVSVGGAPAVLGARVAADTRGAQIAIRERAAGERAAARATVVVHKPAGYCSDVTPPPHLASALELVRDDLEWPAPRARARAAPALEGLAPCGRLDAASTGLLVYSNDGRVARALIGGGVLGARGARGAGEKVSKEYVVRVAAAARPHAAADRGPHTDALVSAAALARLRHGLSLDGVALRRARVDALAPQSPLGPGEAVLRFVLREGRKRQIRRMCARVNLRVLSLARVRVGRIEIGDLPLGRWRHLAPGEAF